MRNYIFLLTLSFSLHAMKESGPHRELARLNQKMEAFYKKHASAPKQESKDNSKNGARDILQTLEARITYYKEEQLEVVSERSAVQQISLLEEKLKTLKNQRENGKSVRELTDEINALNDSLQDIELLQEIALSIKKEVTVSSTIVTGDF